MLGNLQKLMAGLVVTLGLGRVDPEGLCSRAADSPQDPGARQRWAPLGRGSCEVICTPCVTPVRSCGPGPAWPRDACFSWTAKGTPGKLEVERQRAALPEGSSTRVPYPACPWPGESPAPSLRRPQPPPPSWLIIQSLIRMK